jgi:hypothetical protein
MFFDLGIGFAEERGDGDGKGKVTWKMKRSGTFIHGLGTIVSWQCWFSDTLEGSFVYLIFDFDMWFV